jgi:hypothetical protein
MKKILLVAVAVLTLAIGATASFAGLQGDSASIAAGGGAYPTGVTYYPGK